MWVLWFQKGIGYLYKTSFFLVITYSNLSTIRANAVYNKYIEIFKSWCINKTYNINSLKILNRIYKCNKIVGKYIRKKSIFTLLYLQQQQQHQQMQQQHQQHQLTQHVISPQLHQQQLNQIKLSNHPVSQSLSLHRKAWSTKRLLIFFMLVAIWIITTPRFALERYVVMEPNQTWNTVTRN